MRKIKNRFFAAVLSILMLLTFAAPCSGAAQTERIGTAIAALSDLDIMRGYEDGSFHSEKQITRMEFVALILRAMGLENHAFSMAEQGVFSDVDSSLWGAGAVNMAVSMGLINGYEDGRFGPSDPVTVNQAVKIMVCALEYKIIAEKQGYPSGYLTIGNSLGILKGLTAGEQPASRGEIALLIYNSLEVPMLVDVHIGSDEEGKAVGEETLLSKMNIKIITATVTGIYGASISGTKLLENQIELSGVRHESRVNAAAFLGLGVRAWVLEEDGTTPVVMHLQGRDSDSLVISAEDVDPLTTQEAIRYWENDSLHTINLRSPLEIVYNGRSLSTNEINNSAYLRPENGRVIVNMDDSSGSMVVVWDYESYVITSVTEDKIYDLYGRTLAIDNKVSFTLLRDGVADSMQSLQVGEVLWAAKSLDGTMLNCEVGGSTVEGRLETVSTDSDNGKTTYLIDGEQFILASCYVDALARGHSKAPQLSLGDYATFTLDPGGRIAAVHVTQEQESRAYGYLIDAQMSGGGLAESGLFKIMTEDNRFAQMETKSGTKIRFGRKIGGSYTTSKENASEVVNAVSDTYTIKKQLVQYELDSEGYLSGFYLADTSANNREFSRDLGQQRMTYAGGVLNQKYFVAPDTPVFYVPNVGRYEEQFYATTAANFFANRTQHTVIVYDIEHLHVGAIVSVPSTENIYSAALGLDTYISMTNSPLMLIEKSSTQLSENGTEYLVISGYVGKTYTHVLVADTITATSAAKADLRPGNVIQYETNDIILEKAMTSDYDKIMVVYRKVFDCNNINQESFQTWNYTNIINVNASISTAYGVISDYDLPYLTVTLNRNTSRGLEVDVKAPFVLGGGTVVLKYNPAREQIEVLRIEDLAIGQKVFVRQRYNNTREVIILE